MRYLSFIMADYAAEIEVWSDGKAEREEITNYDEVQNSIPSQRYLYPELRSDKSSERCFQEKGKDVPTRGWCPSLQGKQ